MTRSRQSVEAVKPLEDEEMFLRFLHELIEVEKQWRTHSNIAERRGRICMEMANVMGNGKSYFYDYQHEAYCVTIYPNDGRAVQELVEIRHIGRSNDPRSYLKNELKHCFDFIRQIADAM